MTASPDRSVQNPTPQPAGMCGARHTDGQVIYIEQDLTTGVAEALVRD